jgi:hypothetical protein
MDELIFVRGSNIEKLVDDLIARDSVAFGGEIHNDAVAKDRFGESANIF